MSTSGSIADISQRILERRSAIGVSQAKLAVLIGASQSTVAQWERRRQIPGAEYLTGLSAALQVSIEWLLTGVTATHEYIETVIRPIQVRLEALQQTEPRDVRSAAPGNFNFEDPSTMSPIQNALLATVTDALKKGALSDAECLIELPRWHALATSDGPRPTGNP